MQCVKFVLTLETYFFTIFSPKETLLWNRNDWIFSFFRLLSNSGAELYQYKKWLIKVVSGTGNFYSGIEWLIQPRFQTKLGWDINQDFFFLSGSVLFDKDPDPEKLHRSGGCGLATLVSWIRIFMQNLSRVRIRMRILITIFLQALSPPVCTYLLWMRALYSSRVPFTCTWNTGWLIITLFLNYFFFLL